MEKTKFIEIKNDLKLGLISDVHGNGDYLEIVINELLKEGVNSFLLLGDMITDFQDTKNIMKTIKKLQEKYPVFAILGNREIDMLEKEKGNRESWGKSLTNGALLLAYQDLEEDDLNMIKSWPENYVITFPNKEKALVTHNSLLNEDQKKLVTDNNISILICGHSHRICNEDQRNNGGLWYINPGSVGLTEDAVSWGGLMEF